jgi:single-strand DNA-binding protein
VFETTIVIVGNVLTAPEWRRTAKNHSLVANFRIASTARRLDRETGRWVDGNSLRVRVNCWRRLAEGVAASIAVGDPVVVAGRLYTRDWTDGEGNTRTSYELEAVSVGHDLARGKGRFYRRSAAVTSTADGPEADGQVRGEAAELVSDDEVPAAYGEGVPDEEEPTFLEAAPLAAVPDDASSLTVADGYAQEEGDGDGEPETGAETLDRGRPRRPSRRQPVPA